MAHADRWTVMALRLEELCRDLADARDIAEGLDGALGVAVELGPCDIASVSMQRPGGDFETTAASDPVAQRCHQIQQQLGEGPCVEVDWGERDLYVVDDVADQQRWPRWAAEARRLGLGSMVAARLFTTRQTVGALDLYSYTRRDYDEDDALTVRLIAARVSAVLAERRNEESLWQAIDARHEVGIAQGLLMERFGLDQDRAFGVLRRYSQQYHRKLRDVARDVIHTRVLPAETAHEPPERTSDRRTR